MDVAGVVLWKWVVVENEEGSAGVGEDMLSDGLFDEAPMGKARG